MFTEKDLHELLEYQSDQPVVSVYLKTDPAEGSSDAFKRNLRSMLKDIHMKADTEAINRYFDHEYDWSGRSAVVFSSSSTGYFRAYSLGVPVRSRVRINNRPHVKPLADILDAYGGYGVAVVDKQGARLFYFHLGELREQEGTMGEEVRRTKRGGASQIHGRRGGTAGQTNYAEELAERNMRDAAEFAAHFFSENNVRRVLIGGSDDNVGMFRGLLPKTWQSLTVGTFPISMNASKEEVLERALRIGQEAERRREANLVKAVVTSAAKGKGGVIHLDETLNALRDGRVQTLFIREGYRAPGYRCQGCGYLTGKLEEACPFCGKNFENIADAVELAVHEVMRLGGEVEVLHDGETTRELGNIGAILRY